jgi:hypothetical protein
MALPMPCKALRVIKTVDDVEIAARKEKTVKAIIPRVRIFFRP